MEHDKVNHLYKSNSYFENAVDLYYFDKKLRNLIFTVVESIEIALRTKMIHHISLKYGAFWFMDPSNFKDSNIHQQCLVSIEQELARTREDFITEHKAKYIKPSMPPVWKTLEVTSFGILSKLFCNIKDSSVKKKIAREFNLPQHIVLESWVKSIVNLRNCLAHHARVWNRNFPIMPQLSGSFRGNWIYNTNLLMVKLYPQLCCLEYMYQQIHADDVFKVQLKALLSFNSNVDIAAMGFPVDWGSEPLWR